MKRILRRWRLLRMLPRYYLVAGFSYGFHPVAGFATLLGSLRARYMPDEAFRNGLLRPGSDPLHNPRFISKSALIALQSRLNPQAWEPVLTDKGIFSRLCQAAGLPIPRTLALLFAGTGGWHPGGLLLDENDWSSFLMEGMPAEFIVKPMLGAYGRQVWLVRRDGQEFVDQNGERCDGAGLLRRLLAQGSRGGWIFQERLRNHHQIVEFTGSAGLQTVRVITLVRQEGTVDIVYAFLKAIVGSNIIDNFQGGLTGNLVSKVDLARGEIERTVTLAPGGGFVEVHHHPVTKLPFRGFPLPFWADSCLLAQRAAVAFLPVRTVGWDIALTPSGPILLEGNFWSDPPNHGDQIPRVVAAFKGG